MADGSFFVDGMTASPWLLFVLKPTRACARAKQGPAPPWRSNVGGMKVP